jgi:hypothetical protein
MVLRRVRERFGVEHDEDGPIAYPTGSVFACVGCLSVWTFLGLYLAPFPLAILFAGSGLVILIHVFYQKELN